MKSVIRGAPPVPQRVLELELTASNGENVRPGDARALRALVRLNGAPAGWLRYPNPAAEVDYEELIQIVRDWMSNNVFAIALRENLLPAAQQRPISVVVCTRDRVESLRRCLDSLCALDYSAFEVVIVDNAPTSDATERLVAQYAADPRIRYVREDRPGLDWARNRGLAEAGNEIVAYTDDNVRVDRGWLRGLARAFEDPDVVLATGLVAPGELETDAQVVFEDWYGGMGKGVYPFAYHRDQLNSFKRIGVHHIGVGANMAFRREWLVKLGGFDTALDVGTPSHGAGDLDAFERTIAAGGLARYEPTALVWHYHRREVQALRRQLVDNGRAFGVYLLSRWLRLRRPASQVLWYTIRIWLGWMVGRVYWRFRRRERMPLALQACEWWGMLQAPWAYIATYRNDLRIRSRDGVQPALPQASVAAPQVEVHGT